MNLIELKSLSHLLFNGYIWLDHNLTREKKLAEQWKKQGLITHDTKTPDMLTSKLYTLRLAPKAIQFLSERIEGKSS